MDTKHVNTKQDIVSGSTLSCNTISHATEVNTTWKILFHVTHFSCYTSEHNHLKTWTKTRTSEKKTPKNLY